MELKQTLTTQVVTFTEGGFFAELRVGLCDGEFLNLQHGYLAKNGKTIGLIIWDHNALKHLGEEQGEAEFMAKLEAEFIKQYNIVIPEPVEMEEPVPPAEEVINQSEIGDTEEIL